MKHRRIGTLTSGITLVLVGIAFLLVSFFPNNEMLILVLKFWPLILILLGIEMLCLRFKNSESELVKFDFASVIMMFLAVGFAVCCEVTRQVLVLHANGVFLFN